MYYEAQRSTLRSPTVNESKVKVAARIVIVSQQQGARGIRQDEAPRREHVAHADARLHNVRLAISEIRRAKGAGARVKGGDERLGSER